jgi:hypothetical protein
MRIDRGLRIVLIMWLAGACARPGTLPRVELAAAAGERVIAGAERRDRIVWLRLSWGARR